MSAYAFEVFVKLECPCGASFEGPTMTNRLRRVIRAFSLAHHHPKKRDARGRFVRWKP